MVFSLSHVLKKCKLNVFFKGLLTFLKKNELIPFRTVSTHPQKQILNWFRKTKQRVINYNAATFTGRRFPHLNTTTTPTPRCNLNGLLMKSPIFNIYGSGTRLRRWYHSTTVLLALPWLFHSRVALFQIAILNSLPNTSSSVE